MEELLRDLRLGVRSLATSSGVTAAAVAALALGVGANSAIFSLVDAVLLRPPTVRDPGELVSILSSSLDDQNPAGAPRLSYLELRSIAKDQTVFDGIAGYYSGPHSLTGGEGPAERIWGSTVTGNYFAVLGVRLPLGPGFSEDDLDPSTSRRVVVLSHELWARRFGASQEAIGRSLEIDGERYTVVGVAPTDFRGVDLELGGWLGSATLPALWIPVSRSAELPFGLDIDDRGARFLQVVVRMISGRSLDEARAYVEARSAQLQEAFPDSNANVRLEAVPLNEARLSPSNRQSVSRFLYVLITVVALVLLIACLNVAGLLLVRANSRQKEIAVRMALGCGRWRIVRQLMVEATLISWLGFLTSIPVAVWCVQLLSTVRLPFHVPLHLDTRVDTRMLAFAAAVALAANLAFGLATAMRASRASAGEALQARVPVSVFRQSGTWRSLLIGSQVALSLVLLTSATLFVRTLMEAQAIEPGFDASNVVAMAVDLQTESFRYDEPMGLRFYRDALDQVSAVADVQDVSWAADLPLAMSRLIIWFAPGEEPPSSDSAYVVSDCDIVGPDYFRTMGIPLLRGRDFTYQDNGDVPVAIVNEAMGRQYWPGRDVLGQRLNVKGRAGVRTVEVVGIARNVQRQTLWDESKPFLYLPVFQRYFPIMNLLVKVEGDAESMIDAVRAQLTTVDPKLPVYDAKLVEEQVDLALSQPRMAAALLGMASLLATLLAAVGVYGVTAYSIGQRTHELGIRSAVGARGADLVRLIVKQGLAPALVGAVVGAASAAGIARYVASSMQGARPLGPLQTALSAAVLLAVVLAACYFPARRAGNLDPVSALRWE